MSDKLKALLESQVLSDDSKEQLTQAFNEAVDARVDEQLQESRQSMVKATLEIVDEAVAEALAPIQEEVRDARTLEARYVEKVVAFKEQYEAKQTELLQQMVAESVAEEIEEMRDDIQEGKKFEFAKQVFEAFKETYDRMGFSEEDRNLAEELDQTKTELETFKRESVMSNVLEGLSGKKRAIASTLLEGVPADKIQSKFDEFSTYLLETVDSEKPAGDEVVTESADDLSDAVGTVVIEGEETESEEDKAVNESKFSADAERRLAKSLRHFN